MTSTLAPTDLPTATPDPHPPARRGPRELGALALLLVGTAALNLWNLGAAGWSNSFYSMAVQAGTKSWVALLFGSLDPGNIITVDKPPAALWVMGLSGRIFGFSPWSMLVPEALMGVGTVALLYAAVRRVAGPNAGLIAGVAMALTPVTVLMFRMNNPDALLVLLTVAAGYATVRAIEKAGTRWLVLAGALIGFAFLTKTLAGFIVLPALALAYLVAAPTGIRRRIGQLLAAGVAIVISAGWWVALTELWPAADRPYIGGSVGNSALQLALGYNGLGRIFGGSGDPGGSGAGANAGMPGGGMPGGGMFGGGEPGITRMFGTEVGGQIAWLLPAALVLLVAGLWYTRRAPRTDPARASLILWGGGLVLTALVFSFAEGIFHSYYTVALAPGIAAVTGIGASMLWRRRADRSARVTAAVLVLGTGGWAWVLLGHSPQFVAWLRWVIVALAVLGAVLVALPKAGRVRAALVAVVVGVACLAGPAAYAADTIATPRHGGIATAGPAIDTGRDRGPGGAAGPAGMPGPAGRGGPGEQTVDPALTALLRGAGTTWSAATTGSQAGAALALGSDTAVMAIGGFTGGDPAPTLEQFQALVAAGDVHYFVEGGGPGGGGPGGGGPGGGGPGGFGAGRTSSEISTWVQHTFTPSTIGGRTVYDLS